jgi:hypothetical protein
MLLSISSSSRSTIDVLVPRLDDPPFFFAFLFFFFAGMTLMVFKSGAPVELEVEMFWSIVFPLPSASEVSSCRSATLEEFAMPAVQLCSFFFGDSVSLLCCPAGTREFEEDPEKEPALISSSV